MLSNPDLLKNKIVETITNQGFYVNGHVALSQASKLHIKLAHSHSRNEQILTSSKFLKSATKHIQPYFLDGNRLNPEKITLELRPVVADSLEEKIYKWWNLAWWSVPYQQAYGRQMRFVIWDTFHNAPFGLIGLQSPVLKMAVRDEYLQLPKADLDIWVNKSMQAQRLGALPPYNQLIGGKMVALALSSNELRSFYTEKYQNSITVLKERTIDPKLLFITTTSAFGKSSIYNRLLYNGEKVALSLGYTKGSGTFHITKELYKDISEFLKEKGEDIGTTFGKGSSRKIKLLYTAFRHLKLPNYSYHNIKREFFLFPLVSNLDETIHLNHLPHYIDRPFVDLTEYWLTRWCSPRSKRQEDWKNYRADHLLSEVNKLIL